MAQKTITTLTDDLDGGPAEETIRFSIDGRYFQVDLSAENAAEMRKVFDRYVDAGQPVKVPAARAARAGVGPGNWGRLGPDKAKLIRAWAVQQGIDISPYGRVPLDVIARYESVHG